jgi:hypothetical protein
MKKILRTVAFGMLFAVGVMQAQVVVRIGPPPPVRREVIPVSPGPRYVWTGGYYRFNGRAYVWVPGHYVIPPGRYTVWVPGHWVARQGGYIWIAGHWR